MQTEILLAGTEPNGRVLRIPKAAGNRRAFVLYETSKKEITALLETAGGDLYVAAVGEKSANAPGLARPITTDASAASNFVNALGPAAGAPGAAPQAMPNPFTPLPTVNSSSVYRIAADGSPEELWSSRDDVVYSMGLLPGGKLLLGTGNDGAVLELEGNRIFSKLVKAASRQITSIAAAPGGKLFLAAANPGKVFTLGPENESEGSYESQPFDARIYSRWGRSTWLGENMAATNGSGSSRAAIYARSGNTSEPDSNWSDWAGPYANPAGDKLECPAARFVQWKAVLRGGGNGSAAPAIDWFSVAYLPKNIPPQVTAIALQDPGVRAQGISLPLGLGAGQQTPAQLQACRSAAALPRHQAGNGFSVANISTSVLPHGSGHFDSCPRRPARKKVINPFCGLCCRTTPMTTWSGIFRSVYFRGENENHVEAVQRQSWTAGFYSWGHHVYARRRLLFENCGHGRALQSRRRRTFIRARIRPLPRG